MKNILSKNYVFSAFILLTIVSISNGNYGYASQTYPNISLIPDQSIQEDTSINNIVFTVEDENSDSCEYTLLFTSSDTTILPVKNIGYECYSSIYNITAIPAENQNGVVNISVMITNSDNLTATTSFNLTITSVNDPPEVGIKNDNEWTWINPFPQGNDLNDMWGTSENNVYAVGNNGAVVHYDGITLTKITTIAQKNLNSIWGSSENDIYATGEYGTFIHYDGNNWKQVNTGFYDNFFNVWGLSSNSVYASITSGRYFHYNGSTWTLKFLGFNDIILDMWGTDDNNLFAVTSLGAIIHYNGSEWSIMSEANGTLNTIWGIDSNNIYAAGYNGKILHYDGNNWSLMENGISDQNILKILGTSSNNIYAVSEEKVLYYNGSTWSEITIDINNKKLGGLWLDPENHIFVCGDTGNIFHYYDNQWTEMSSGYNLSIESIWGSSPSNIITVGEYATTYHYNGSEWIFKDAARGHFKHIFGLSENKMYAAGIDVIQYDGNNWSNMQSRSPVQLYGVWASSENNIFAVGLNGTIMHYSDNGWSALSSGTSNDLYSVWGSSPNNVYAVGKEGTIIKYDGSQWSSIDSGTSAVLKSIWGSAASNIFVVGESSTIIHFDGKSWSSMNAGLNYNYHSVWGTSGTNVYATGEGSNCFIHYDGNTWKHKFSGVSLMHGIWASSKNNIYMVGPDGAILNKKSIIDIPSQTFEENSVSNSISFSATDDDKNLLTITAYSKNQTLISDNNMSIVCIGDACSLNFTPGSNQFGSANIIIVAEDTAGLTHTTEFTVNINEINDPPEFVSNIDNWIINEDTELSAYFSITDSDSPENDYTITFISSDQTILPNKNIRYAGNKGYYTITAMPLENKNGHVNITVTANDLYNNTIQTSFDITITAVNDPPEIGSISDQTVDEDTKSNSISFTTTDIDGDPLTTTAYSNNQTLIKDNDISIACIENACSIDFTPNENQYGSSNINILTKDPNGLTHTTAFTVNILAINDSPEMSTIPDQSTYMNVSTEPISFTINDIESNASSLSLSALSSNEILVPNENIIFSGTESNRTVRITPIRKVSGITDITIILNDPENLSKTQTFQLTVNKSRTITTDHYIDFENINFETIDLTIGDGINPITVTLNGSHTFENLLIKNHARLTHEEISTNMTYFMDLAITGNLTIDTGGQINVDGRGFSGAYQGGNLSYTGITYGNTTKNGSSNVSGGSHGGTGGSDINGFSGVSYGSVQNPIYPGAGGGAVDSNHKGGNGGGVIILKVDGDVKIDGSVSANGNNAGINKGGGGAGGTIQIHCNTIYGDGYLSANGGNGGVYTGCDTGGGGGGRISIHYASLGGNILNANRNPKHCFAHGGLKNENGTNGGAGTIYRDNSIKNSDKTTLIIDNNNLESTESSTPLSNDLTRLGGLFLYDSGVSTESLTYVMTMYLKNSKFTFNAGSPQLQTVLLNMYENSVLTHEYCTSNTEAKIDIVCEESIDIDSSSRIIADERGYLGGFQGDNFSEFGRTKDNIISNGSSKCYGGSYGGFGGSGAFGQQGYIYGDINNPNYPGAGGGSYNHNQKGGNGGGLIRITTDSLNLDGIISANGGDGCSIAGGGAGGSIKINAHSLSGNGIIESSGGDGGQYSNYSTGGGGGGRIYALLEDKNQFTGTFNADGGLSYLSGENGEKGTSKIIGIISEIENQITQHHTSIDSIGFTVTALETENITVSCLSSNQDLVLSKNCNLNGTGLNYVSFDAISGESYYITLTITPNIESQGQASININVQNSKRIIAAELFDLTIIIKPEISKINSFTINEDTIHTVNYTAYNPLSDPCDYTQIIVSSNDALVPLSSIKTICESNNISLTLDPLPDQYGSASISITLINKSGYSDHVSFTVNVMPVNDRPLISKISDIIIPEDTTVDPPICITIQDMESNPIDLTVTGFSSNKELVQDSSIIITGNGANRLISISPEYNQYGDLTITVLVSDGELFNSTDFVLHINPVNDIPTITNIDDQTCDEDMSITIPFSVFDSETQANNLSISIVSDNPNLISDKHLMLSGSDENRLLSIMPAKDQFGFSTITISVSDGNFITGLTYSESFNLNVSSINDPPEISAIPNQTNFMNNLINPINFTINDIDTSTSSLSLSAISSNEKLVSIDNIVFTGTDSNRTVTITPNQDLTGTTNISIIVNDLDKSSTMTTFTLEILDRFVLITEDLYIDVNDLKYEDLNLAIGDGVHPITVTINGTHSFDSLVVKNNATLVHEKTDTENTYLVDFTIKDNLTIETGGLINGDSRGYLGGYQGANTSEFGRTKGNTITGGSSKCYGGSHGGLGGVADNGQQGHAYGILNVANLPGSGGGSYNSDHKGGNGGGVIRITATDVINNGIISVNGGDGLNNNAGGGAGGSIYIKTESFSGTGTITANGGNAGNYANFGISGGGGGRIAIFYQTNTFNGHISAYGGQKYSTGDAGGAGTIYYHNLSNDQNSLVVDNNGNKTKNYSTPEPYFLESGTIDDINQMTLTDNNASWIENQFAGCTLLFDPKHIIAFDEWTYDEYYIYGNTENTLNIHISKKRSGSVYKSTFEEYVNPGDDYIIVLNDFNSIVLTGSAFVSFDLVNVKSNTIEIKENSTLTHSDSKDSKISGLTLDVNNLIIEENSSINVDGRGYLGGYQPGNPSIFGRTTGNQIINGSSSTAGGSYGGIGGHGNSSSQIGFSYDNFYFFVEPGAGGGAYDANNPGGNGGGIMYLKVSGNLVNNGIVSANGLCPDLKKAGGGAGGRIKMSVGTLKGNGVISANGGDAGQYPDYPCGGGGGGRIILSHTTNEFEGIITAYGGNDNYSGGCGGAGTIYINKNNSDEGILIIDNNNHLNVSESSTPLLLTGHNFLYYQTYLETLHSLTISNGAKVFNESVTTIKNNLTLDNGWLTQGECDSSMHINSLDLKNSSVLTHAETNLNTVYSLDFYTYWISRKKSSIKINVDYRITIDSTSRIDVNGRGYLGGYSGGNLSSYGLTNGNTTTGGSSGCAGGSHGGLGGVCHDSDIASIYGYYCKNCNWPYSLNPGSGGGAYDESSIGGDGGGIINFTTKELIHNGTISANGADGYLKAGGGAGGDILIWTETFSGSGTFEATGGDGGQYSDYSTGGGGGGRIEIHSIVESNFNGTLSVAGGMANASGKNGENGTIYCQPGIYVENEKNLHNTPIDNVKFYLCTDSSSEIITITVLSSNIDLITADGFKINDDNLLYKTLSGDVCQYFDLNFTPTIQEIIRSNLTIKVNTSKELLGHSTFNLIIKNRPDISEIQDVIINEDTVNHTINYTAFNLSSDVCELSQNIASSNTDLLPIDQISSVCDQGNFTLTLNPLPDQSGSTSITITMTNELGVSDSETFTLFVNPMADRPAFVAAPNSSGHEDTAIPLTIGMPALVDKDQSEVLSDITVSQIPDHAMLSAGTKNVDGTWTLTKEQLPSLTITPGLNETNSFTLIVSVTSTETENSDSAMTTQSIAVNIIPVNDAPTISNINDQETYESTPTSPIGFTIGDIETNADKLIVSANSSNSDLISQSQIVLKGTGMDRSIILIPKPHKYGLSTITISVKDELNGLSETSFVLVVQNVVRPGDFNDNGLIELIDSQIALNILAGNDGGTFYMEADVNKNQRIDLQDVIYIQQYINKLPCIYDPNNDKNIDLKDVIIMLQYLTDINKTPIYPEVYHDEFLSIEQIIYILHQVKKH